MLTIPCSHSKQHPNRYASLHNDILIDVPPLNVTKMLQPMFTMHGFNWFDRRGTEGVGFIRALRVLLTNNLPHILPDLGVIIRARFAELHESHSNVNGMIKVPRKSRGALIYSFFFLGAKGSPVYPMVVKLVVLSNAVSFFGKDLGRRIFKLIVAIRVFLTISPAKNEDFMVSALQYIEQTLICAEIIRLLPTWMEPLV